MLRKWAGAFNLQIVIKPASMRPEHGCSGNGEALDTNRLLSPLLQ